MSDLSAAFGEAIRLITTLDGTFLEIVLLSLTVSGSAVALAALVGIPLGAALAAGRFRGQELAGAIINALMGLPPVVVGLAVYMMLSNSGPLGGFQLLYTPAAMIIAQTVLVLPIVTALTRQTLADLGREYGEFFRGLGLSRLRVAQALMWDGRHSLVTAVLAGFGRAIAEVGAVIVVGGNINHVTRTMTTAIALETARGELALALGLGIVLLTLALAINAAVMALGRPRTREQEA
jgi:tungstate transport system permease protein